MGQIPLSSLMTVGSFSIGTICAILLWFRRKKTDLENAYVKRFIYMFLLSSLTFFFYAVPGVITTDVWYISISYHIAGALVLITDGCFAYIPLAMFFPDMKKFVINLLVITLFLFAFFFLIWNLALLEPAVPVIIGPFIDWQGKAEPTVQNISTVLNALSIIAFIFLFFFYGWRHSNYLVRHRSRFMTIGFFFLLLGSVVTHLFGLLPMDKSIIFAISSPVGALLVSAGMFLLLKGVLYRSRENI